jgi:hypothetical protein
MNELPAKSQRPTTDRPYIDPALRAAVAPEHTDEQIEAASQPPSLDAIFAAHLKLLALQDTERQALDR